MIQAIHTKVPGRARYRVEGLYRSPPLKKLLEFQLSQHSDIIRAYASITTGNLLVYYNSGNDHQTIAALVQEVLTETERLEGSPEAEKKGKGSQQKPRTEQARPQADEEPAWRSAAKRLRSSEEQKGEPWHSLDVDSVLSSLEVDRETGLTEQAAKLRFKRHGPNVLPEAAPRPTWKIFTDQFASLPVALLGAAAGLSVFTGGLADAAIITGVVVANAFIGFLTEREAEKTIRSLKGFVQPSARVVRNGRVHTLAAEEIVVGDVLILKPGTYIAADSRVLEASHLSVDESTLTGESMPVIKTPKSIRKKAVSLADRHNMAYMGTLVTGGEGRAVVVATGRFTEIGRLQVLLDETTSPKTPIEKQLSRTGDQLVLIATGICGVVFLIGLWRGYRLLELARMAISLAAAAVPEGLPAAATITFSLGIKNMRKHQVLIRQLQAVETLGAVQTVCLDKTGTITRNRMSVLSIFTGGKRIEVHSGGFLINGHSVEPLQIQELEKLLQVCTLCSETQIRSNEENGDYVLTGSPTERALVRSTSLSGIDVSKLRKSHKLLRVSHRSESRLFMGSLHATPERGRFYAVKGSPPEVIAMCRWQMKNGRKVRLTEKARLAIETENEQMAGRALRVLGVAYATFEKGAQVELEEDLTWLGLVGMADPIREGVGELIEVFHRAGLDTVMITGDQSPTAHAVAQELNLSQGDPLEILDSSELTSVDPEVLQALSKRVHVYARVSPSHKLMIVQALQSTGRVVAMTGDGINDGPALKAADIGIAMGRSGTDIARGVADVVLEKDNLETLIVALRDGRGTYNNIRKSVHFFLSTNLSEIMVMFAAMAAGIGFPINAMQLLWINIISDIFPGLALSMEAPESDVLDEPPRDPEKPLLDSADFKRMVLASAVITGATLGAYGYGLTRYGMGARAGSLAFQSLTIAQLLHALGCRSERHRLFEKEGPPPNKYLNLALGGSLALQVLTLLVPGLRRVLGITAVNWTDMAVIAGSALLPLAVNELTKKTTLVKNDAKPHNDDV
jgi:Ca2+-transporting ATPase